MLVSIVVPVYNSASILPKLNQRLQKCLEGLYEVEIIYVDDFSKDQSWSVLKDLKKQFDNLKIVKLGKNFGQHSATLCGFNFAQGECVVTIDDDLQQGPEDISKLIDVLNESNAELVYGIGNSNHSKFRKAGSDLYKKGAKHIDGKMGEGSSFRALKKSLVDKVKVYNNHFVMLEEILYWHTRNIEFVAVNHYPRMDGKSGYSPLKIFRFIVDISVNYSNWPLKFMTYGGAILSFVFFCLGIYFIAKKVIYGASVPGFTALIVAIFFSTSVLLLCFGIVGKYLNNIYVVLNKKPVFSIEEAEL